MTAEQKQELIREFAGKDVASARTLLVVNRWQIGNGRIPFRAIGILKWHDTINPKVTGIIKANAVLHVSNLNLGRGFRSAQ